MKPFLLSTISLLPMSSFDTIVKYQYHQQHNHNLGCIFIVVVNIINEFEGVVWESNPFSSTFGNLQVMALN